MLRTREQDHDTFAQRDAVQDPDRLPGKHTLTEGLVAARRSLIVSSVGRDGHNARRDVGAVQAALARHGHAPGPIDHLVGPQTIAAIERFQAGFLAHPDGLVEPGGLTELRLGQLPRPVARPEPARVGDPTAGAETGPAAEPASQPTHATASHPAHDPETAAGAPHTESTEVKHGPDAVTSATGTTKPKPARRALDDAQDVRDTLAQIRQWEPIIQHAAAQFGIRPDDIRAIIGVESHARPGARAGGPHGASGLMQVTEETWHQMAKQYPTLAPYDDFASYWSRPEINIMFGAATLASKRKSLERLGVPVGGPRFAELAVTAYNGGEGVVSLAIRHAREAGSTDPEADCLSFEHLSYGVEHAGESHNQQIWKYYMPGHAGAQRNRSGTREEAIRLKTEEVKNYPTRVAHYLEEERRQGSTGEPTPRADGPDASAAHEGHAAHEGDAAARAATPSSVIERTPARDAKAQGTHDHAAEPARGSAAHGATHARFTEISRNFQAAIPGSSLTWHDALYLPTWGRHVTVEDVTNTALDTVLDNIVRQAAALDKVRDHFGKRLVVHCWLRSPAYNQRVRGASNSAHLRGAATDFHIDGVSAETVRRALKSDPGLYPGAGENSVSWVHLDLEHRTWFHP